MKKLKQDIHGKINIILRIGAIIAMCIVAVYVIWGEITLPSERDRDMLFCFHYKSEWTQTLSDGSTKQVSLPGMVSSDNGKNIDIQNVLPRNISGDAYLIFRTAKQDYAVYVDGVLRKSYTTGHSRFFGNVSPTSYLFVKIGPYDNGKTIRVLTKGAESNLGDFQSVFYANYGGFWDYMIKKQGRIVFMGLLMCIVAVVGLVLSVVFRFVYKREQKLGSLSLGVLLVSVWVLADSVFRQIIFSNVSVIGDLTFLMVMLLPIPFGVYMNQLQNKRYMVVYNIAEFLALADFVFCTVLYAAGIKNLSDMFVIMAAFLFFTIAVIIITMLIDLFTGKIKEYWVSAGAIGLAVIVAGMQAINYIILDETFDISLASIGLLLMLLVAIVDMLSDMMQIQNERNAAVIANETKSLFLANVSHEIRTPINAVLGMNDMILKESSEEHILSYAKDVEESGNNLLGLINDILDLSKIESGKMELLQQEYDVKKLIDTTVSLVKNRADAKALDFKIVVNPGLPRYLYGDTKRLQQVLLNLLTNAIKYTDVGFVELKVDFEKETEESIKLLFYVTDSGRGIAESDLDKLFDSFERLDKKKNLSIEGTGLGLAITKRIVDMMQGSIGVESQYEKGSCFHISVSQKVVDYVEISHYEYDEGCETKGKKAYCYIVAEGIRILAVDDVPMNLKVLSGMLKHSKMQIDFCNSGPEAIEAWQKNTYDLVFMDHMMPEMDGIECAKIMWEKSGKNQDVPIIMLTANAIQGVQKQFLEIGFADYLSKPYTQEQLTDMLCKHLPKGRFEVMGKEDAYKVTINESVGMAFCGGNREFFVQMIQEYGTSDQTEKLQNAFTNKNWKDYKILVHSLKGTSLTFGFESFSAEAKEMEQAVKDENITYIEKNHNTLLDHYRKVLEYVKEHYKE